MKRKLLNLSNREITFVPENINGLFLDLDGSDIKADGLNYTGSVDQWVNKIQDAYSVNQLTPALQPSTSTINGETTVRFNTRNNELSGTAVNNFSAAFEWTLNIVFKAEDADWINSLVSFSNLTQSRIRLYAETRASKNTFIVTDGAQSSTFIPWINELDTLPHVLTLTHSVGPQEFDLYLDKVHQGTVAGLSGYTNNNLFIGHNNSSHQFDGHIGRIIAYDSINPTIQSNLEDFMISKYAI